MIQATYLGTGTAFSRRYGNTNVLIEQGGVGLMVDFGFTTPERLNVIGRDLRAVTHVAVSHIHADHVGGLEELAFMSRFVLDQKPTLLLPHGLAADLWDTALRGGLELTAGPDGEKMVCTIDTYFNTVVLDDEWKPVGGLEIKAFANDHVPGKATYGFIVRDRESGGQMIFGCDVRRRITELECEPVHPDFARGPIFHDCQLYDDGPSGVHIPFHQLLEYPASVRERIVLVHYNDTIVDNLSMIREHGFKVAWPRDVIRVPGWRESLEQSRAQP